jgi:hypothetical protein
MFASLMSFGSAVTLVLQIAKKLVELGEKNGWIEEGERRFILKESLAVNKALIFKDKVKGEKLTLEELFREMEGDFID